MKNAIKFLGIIALIAVIGLSFAACGDPEQGPTGEKGEKGDPGGLLPYIPAESGLLGSTWILSSPNYRAAFSNDGYTFTDTNIGSGNVDTYAVHSYGKRPDGTHIVYVVRSSGSNYLRKI
jgi:hypothetical protein